MKCGNEVIKLEYEQNFPSLATEGVNSAQGNIVGENWAKITEGNRNKNAGTDLEYVEPVVIDGFKCVSCSIEDVQNEMQIWNFLARILA